ncbi:uncharacterized protein EAF01_003771 [Botrytis porri]|uniref:uncharacterized protein n=1 Tax=Botrytis porri TaxID=87229 RepID=UPI00190144B0|nr:uncharacterized protein EAF01_003771 [Botrytis porri]KAF7910053.1 hypothetical protein EAF01_003771 [Botrytis porri]
MWQVVWITSTKQRDRYPLDLMISGRMGGATDPRDKVVALLGLIEKGQLSNIVECDYKGKPFSVDAAAHHASNTVDLTSWESDLRPLAMELRISDDPIPGLPHWSLDLKACPSNGEGDYPLQGYPHYIMQRARPPDRPGALAEYCFKDKNGAIVERYSSR